MVSHTLNATFWVWGWQHHSEWSQGNKEVNDQIPQETIKETSAQDVVIYVVTLHSCCILYTFSEGCIFFFLCLFMWRQWCWIFVIIMTLVQCTYIFLLQNCFTHNKRLCLVGNSDANERLAVVFSISFLWRQVYSKFQVMWAVWVFKVCSELVYPHSFLLFLNYLCFWTATGHLNILHLTLNWLKIDPEGK